MIIVTEQKNTLLKKLSIPGVVVIFSLILITSLTLFSVIIGTSNNPCSECHGNYSQRCNLLPNDGLSSLPTVFSTGSNTDVKIAVELTATGNIGSYPEYYKINELRVTLSSDNSRVNIQNPQKQMFNQMPNKKVTFNWTVGGKGPGSDTLTFSLWANNSHDDTEGPFTFSDSHFYDISVSDKPLSPRNPSVRSGDGFAEVTWQPPSFDGGSAITGYDVHKDTTSGSMNKPLFTSVPAATTKFNDTSVTNGQTYYYYIKAKNSIGISDPSMEIIGTPIVTKTVPTPPRNLTATPGSDYIDIDWDEPIGNGGSPITNYKIYSGSSSGVQTELTSIKASTTVFQDTSVINGITYYYYVTAINSIGESKPSNEVSAASDGTPPSLVIINPKFDSYINISTVKIEWTGADVGMGLDYFEIKLDNGNWIDIGKNTSYIYSSLTEGEHTVYLKAMDTMGNTNETTVKFKIDITHPSVMINAPEDNSLLNISNVSIIWSSIEDGSGIKHYELRYNKGSWDNVGTNESYNLTNIIDGIYKVEIIATDKALNIAKSTLRFNVDVTRPNVITSSVTNGKGSGPKGGDKVKFTAGFSEGMLKESVLVTFSGGSGTVTWEDNILTFISDKPLGYGKYYEISVFGTDLAGNYLLPNLEGWSTKEQETITGVIVDQNGDGVYNATISLVTGISTTSDLEGRFVIKTNPGTYSISISKTGYQTVKKVVTVNEGKTTNMNQILLPSLNQKKASDPEEQGFAVILYVIITITIIIIILVIIFSWVRSRKKYNQ